MLDIETVEISFVSIEKINVARIKKSLRYEKIRLFNRETSSFRKYVLQKIPAVIFIF